MTPIDIILGLGLIAFIFFATKKSLKDFKQGKCAGCSCSAKKKQNKPVNIEF